MAIRQDFAGLLVKRNCPYKSSGFDLTSWQKVRSNMGLKPKHAACEGFGRYPGLAGFAGEQFGLPPEWTDKGAKKTATETPAL